MMLTLGCRWAIFMRGRCPLQSIRNKNVLITGSGRGIGKRLAIGFAAQGAKLGLLARSKAELQLTRLEIEHAGGIALQLRADVMSYNQVRAAVDRMRARLGEVDVLVCAAGVAGPIGPVWEASPQAWSTAIQTNLVGVLHACRAVLPRMVERRTGKIIVLGGGGTMRPRPYFSAYAASKAAIVRLVETIAEEVWEHNIQVNCMGPGQTYTHTTDEILKAGEKAGAKDAEEAFKTRATGGTPPEKQIELALFLASEESNHVSGRLIHIQDNWKRLRHSDVHPELYTLRRIRKL